MIRVGDRLPEHSFTTYAESVGKHMTSELFKGRVVLFAVPGAFTPTCSAKHLPGFVASADAFKKHGARLVCISVNDIFVMKAWADQQQAHSVTMAADGNGEFTRKIGLGADTGPFGGFRSLRYAMAVEDGVVKGLFVEKGKQFRVSSAEYVLEQFSAAKL
ncbi:Peroxiredoxin-2E [Diplonema papillatum]|nr:Peroxiredoxin-2E [Diplonema papillatum]|eukprot:gene9558-14835_t